MRTIRTALSVMLICLFPFMALSDEKKADDRVKKEKGTVTGVITKIDAGKVTIKSEEKSIECQPYWRGRAPKDGGGFDKAMMKKLAAVKVGDKVKIAWTLDDHRRIDSIEKAE